MLSRHKTALIGLLLSSGIASDVNADEPFRPLGLAFAPMIPMQIYPEDGALIIMLDYEPSEDDWIELRQIYCESADLMKWLGLSTYIVDTEAGRTDPVLVENACEEAVG